MTRTTKIAALAVCLLLATSAVSATAFTSISLQRDANIAVAADDGGVVQLDPGSSSFVTLESGQLAIDVTNGGASGTNVESLLKIGKQNEPTQTHAFEVTNNDDAQRELTFEYTLASDAQDTAQNTDNVQFVFYDSDGNEVNSLSEGGSVTLSPTSGQTYYVVLVVDTSGSAISDDLSGTLNITSS